MFFFWKIWLPYYSSFDFSRRISVYLDYSRATFIFHSRPLRIGVILIGELSSHFPIWWLLFAFDVYTSKRWVLRSSNTWLPRPWLRPRPFPYKTPIYLPLPCFSRACFIYSGFISIKMYAQMESLPVALSNYLSFKGYNNKPGIKMRLQRKN